MQRYTLLITSKMVLRCYPVYAIFVFFMYRLTSSKRMTFPMHTLAAGMLIEAHKHRNKKEKIGL